MRWLLEGSAVAILITVIVVGLGCAEPTTAADDANVRMNSGRWFQIRPYPNAPEGTVCYHYETPGLDSATGGTVCTVPTAK